jgi:hypothetical protein
VDEKDNSARPKRTRVLRAADVMPPFDKLPDAAGAERTDCEPPEHAVPQPGDSDSHVEQGNATGPFAVGVSGPDAGSSAAPAGEVPKYDLAENILAEQRRVAARRRRSPSQTQEEPLAVPPSGDLGPSVDEGLSEDLPELQRIVAEIVARDIDRLCRRPMK